MTDADQKDEITLVQFLDAVADGNATPGGGSVSALAGSLASALVEMVANLTLGKKGFEAHGPEFKNIQEEAHTLREALTRGIVQDIHAYQEVMQAYLLPKKTEEEKRIRKAAIQGALKKAADPPLFTAATSLKIMELCRRAVEDGNPNAVSDAAVGAFLAETALMGGIFNVLVNLSALDDKHYVEKMKGELRRLDKERAKLKGQIMQRLNEKIGL